MIVIMKFVPPGGGREGGCEDVPVMWLCEFVCLSVYLYVCSFIHVFILYLTSFNPTSSFLLKLFPLPVLFVFDCYKCKDEC